MSNDGLARIVDFALERHSIYERRRAGQPWPWTDDPILREWRFTNCYRDLDTVTQWLRSNWYDRRADAPDLWFSAVVARHVNWPETLQELSYPIPWSAARFRRVLDARAERGEKVFTGAYMIKAGRVKGVRKTAALTLDVLTPIWEHRRDLRPRPGEPLRDFHARLLTCYGLSDFMAGQVIADAKPYGALAGAEDWWTFAVPGPGSRRGLNRVFGRPVSAPWRPDEWQAGLAEVCAALNAAFRGRDWPRVSAQDAQNTLCEYDKYERVRLGEGQPRARYRRTV